MGPIRDHGADAEMERRASRLYDWVILSKAFAHWFRSSQDEVERTAIARRYILRRRYFGTWRSHQVDVEAEVQAFRLRTLLRIWKRAAIHHEVQENVAVQRYCHDLAKHVFRTWWDEYRTQLAEDFRSYHLRANCILVWQAETKRVVRGYEKSLFEDERFLLGEAISAWVEKVVAFRSIEFGCTQQRVVARLQGALEEWRTMARLNKTLREVVNDNSLRTQRQVIDLWRTQAAEADQTAVLSKKSFLQGFIAHWANEGKLRSYDSQKQRELKLEILSHWRMDRKLICYQRLCEQRTKERLLAKLRAAAANGQAEEVAMLHTATLIAERREKSLILGTWRQRTIANLNQQDMALDRHYLFAASSYLTRWYEAAREEDVRIADLETFAARGAYYVATSSVLRSWVDVTKRMRKDRLTRSYHTLRRRHKMKVAVQCLSRWRAAIHDSHSRSYQADHMYGGYLRVQLADCVRLWRNATDTVQVMRDVAQTADLEVWWGKWSRRANDLQETELDAGDYANEQTLSRCWRTWEYAMLQNKGRQHVVATLQDNNDRKLCRQVLSDWSQKAAPGVLADLRSSVASRRSVRYGNVRAVDTSRFGTTGSPPSSQPPVVQLPQIEEDLSNIYAVNARRQFGRASEPGRNPFTSGAKELSACLPQRPRGFSKHDATPVTAGPGLQPPISSFPASAGIPATGLASLDTQRPPTQQPHLQETPYSQRRPKQEFDEDEISFHPSEANDYPATFMSTPTRWTGIARSLSSGPNRTQQPPQSASFRRPATVVPTTAATTTPSALLDTPYERALRREYGGSEVLGSERRSAMAAARMVATPKVTFADIREESGEGTYHEE
jgi:protein SFI1